MYVHESMHVYVHASTFLKTAAKGLWIKMAMNWTWSRGSAKCYWRLTFLFVQRNTKDGLTSFLIDKILSHFYFGRNRRGASDIRD